MKRRQFSRVRWNLFIQRYKRYRHGTARERRIIELKISAALAVHDLRRRSNLTQEELGELLGISQSRVSLMEQIQEGVSLDLYAEALVALGATDEQIGRAFNVSESIAVKKLRERAALPYYPKPRPDKNGLS